MWEGNLKPREALGVGGRGSCDLWGGRQRPWWFSHKPRNSRSRQKLEEAKDSLLKPSEGTWLCGPGATHILVSTASFQNRERINLVLEASQFGELLHRTLGSNTQAFSGASEKGCLSPEYKDILLNGNGSNVPFWRTPWTDPLLWAKFYSRDGDACLLLL